MHGDHQHRKPGHGDQKPDLRAPVGQRGRCRRRRDRRRSENSFSARADIQPVLAIDRAGQAQGPVVGSSKDCRWKNGPSLKFCPIIESDVGITGQQRAVAVEHRDRGIVSEREAGEELFEIGRLDAAADGAEEFAVAAR